MGKLISLCAHSWRGFAEGILQVFCVYGFVFQVICEKTLCSKDFKRNLRDKMEKNKNMKIIPTIFRTNLFANLFLSLFCPFVHIKNKNQIFSKSQI